MMHLKIKGFEGSLPISVQTARQISLHSRDGNRTLPIMIAGCAVLRSNSRIFIRVAILERAGEARMACFLWKWRNPRWIVVRENEWHANCLRRGVSSAEWLPL